MTTEEYVTAYNTNKEKFHKFFGQASKQYWKIWTLHNTDGISYDKLAYQFDYSKSSIKNINDKVTHFLSNPCLKDEKKEYSLDEMNGSVYYPNAFIGSVNSLSLKAHKIFVEAVYLYQNNMPLEIPRNHILQFSAQYKNIDRRNKLFNELRHLKIKINDNEEFHAFSMINDNEETMEFEFTEDCMNYINPLRWLLMRLSSTDDY